MDNKHGWFLSLGLLLLVSAACTWPVQLTPTTVPSTPVDPGVIDPPAAAIQAQTDLAAALAVPPDQILIAEIKSVQWANSCLDAPDTGEVCAQQLTDGYEILLTHGNDRFTYHTDLSGSQIRRILQESNPSQAALQARSLLAGLLGYDPENVRILSEEAVKFNDICLEIATPETACPQIMTRGSRIALEADGILFEFRTPEYPINPVLATAGGLEASEFVIMYSRQGGVNQYCDYLNITLGGKAIQYGCSGFSAETPGILEIPIQDQARLMKWALKFTSFDLRQTRLDKVGIHVTFTGIGREETRFEDQQEILQFAEGWMRSPQPFPTPLPTVGPQG